MSDEEFSYDSGEDFSGSDNEEMYSEDPASSESDDELSQNGLDKGDNEYPIEVLEHDKIVRQMADSVKEVNNVTMIPENKVKTLLNHFRWDKNKLLERFYSVEQDDIFKETVPIQIDSDVLECQICYDTISKGNMTGLDCGHIFCTECWSEYLSSKIEDASRIIECPDTKCNTIVDDETLTSIITDTELKLKYNKLVMSYYVECNKMLKWCSAPDCNFVIKVPFLDSRTVTCKCGNSFCFSCSGDWHDPIDCDMLKKWVKKSNDDSETSKWISVHTKDCPKCKMPIEKDGGCNHMSCKNKSCSFQFCWLCLKKWGSCSYDCNRFIGDEEKLSYDQKRVELERFVFYSDRYLTHLKSLSFDKDLYKMAEEKMEEMTVFNYSLLESKFMKNGVDILCRCRKTLMYTYVFGYYLNKNNQKVIFEENQKDLETAIDNLSGFLEREVNSMDALEDLKKKVLDMSNYCELRRKTLVAHVLEGNDQDWWEIRPDNDVKRA